MLGVAPLGLQRLGSRPMTKNPRASYRPDGAADEARKPPGGAIPLESRSFESDTGVTVLVSSRDEPAGAPMVMMSVSLLRRLLAAARAMGPRPPKKRRSTRRKLDIRV